MSVLIRAAVPSDVELFAPRAHPLDAQELWTGFRRYPADALRDGIALSDEVYAAFVDDDPVAVFGCVPFNETTGIPWSVSTTAREHCGYLFCRKSKKYVDAMKARYTMLANYIDPRNTDLVIWLEWLGFTVHAPAEIGPYHAYFSRFDWHV